MPRKTVAIRGLNTELYTEVFSMAKKDGKNVADVVNNALEQFINADGDEQTVMMPGGALSNSAEFILAIDDDGEISLSKEDIKEICHGNGSFCHREQRKPCFRERRR